MKKKRLLKKLAKANARIQNLESVNRSLTQNGILVSSQYESVCARLDSETTELQERLQQAQKRSESLANTINSLQKQNKTLKEHVAYLERIKLYGKVTATDYVDASKEAIPEQPTHNKGVLGIP